MRTRALNTQSLMFLKGIVLAALSLVIVGTLSSPAQAFQVSCASRGYWTSQAMAEMQRLEGVFRELKDDPNCKSLPKVLEELQSARRIMAESDLPEGENTARFRTLPGEVSSIYSYLRSTPDAGKGGLIASARGLLVNRILGLAAAKNNVGPYLGFGSGVSMPVSGNENKDLAMSWDNMNVRARRTALQGLNIMNSVFGSLPQLEQCVSVQPDKGLMVVSAAVTMFAAFASGEDGVTHQLGQNLATLATFLRDMKFAKVIGKLKRLDYWANLSCLLESSSNVYCNMQDAYSILAFQNSGYRYSGSTLGGPLANQKEFSHGGLSDAEVRELGQPDHPLHGYFIMAREVPTISRWLQEVQFGVEPRLKQDAEFKNTTLSTMTVFLSGINNIKAAFNEKMVIYNKTSDVKARRYQLFNLLQTIVNTHLTNRMGEENFFLMAVPEKRLPYYLLGYDEVPQEILPNQYRTTSADWNDWIENGGKFRPEWEDPDKLLGTIRTRLWALLDTASELGSNWFRQRFNVDPVNLLSRSVTDPNLSALESLVSVYGYMTRLLERLSKDPNRNYVILPDLVDTIDRVQKVLASFQEIKVMTKELFPNGIGTADEIGIRIAKLEPAKRKRISETAAKILTDAYIHFNIILQRDTFLANRLNTFVMYDYADRLRRGEGMDQYVRDLMVVTGRNLMDRLIESQGTDPNQAKADLDNASTQIVSSLETLEQLFADDIELYLLGLYSKAGGTMFVPGTGMSPGLFVTTPSEDTSQRSFDQTKAKVCLQTLQFKNFQRFREYCRGAVWRSQFDTSPYKAPDADAVSYSPMAVYQAMKDAYSEIRKLWSQSKEVQGVAPEARAATTALQGAAQMHVDGTIYSQAPQRVDTTQLSVSYDEIFEKRRLERGRFGFNHSCVVRDFLRKNQVYWLTSQFEDYQKERFEQIQQYEKRWQEIEEKRRQEQQQKDEKTMAPAPGSTGNTGDATAPTEEPAPKKAPSPTGRDGKVKKTAGAPR